MAIVGEAVMACKVTSALFHLIVVDGRWMNATEQFNLVSRSEVQVSRPPLTVRPSLSMDVDSHPPNERQVPTSLCSCSFSLREFLTVTTSTASGLARYPVRTLRKLLLPGRAP